MSDQYGTQFPQPPIQFGGIELLKPGSGIMVGCFRGETAEDPHVEYFDSPEAALSSLKPTVQASIEVPELTPLANGEIVLKTVLVDRQFGGTREPVAKQFSDAAHVLSTRSGSGKGVESHPLFDLRLRATVARALHAWLERSHRHLVDPEQRRELLVEIRQKLDALRAAYPPILKEEA